MTDIKTVIVNSLNSTCPATVTMDGDTIWIEEKASQGETCVPIDADRLATALHAIVYDREKVRAALLNACANEGVICGDGPDEPLIIERTIDDEFIDRLIAGLSGGSE